MKKAEKMAMLKSHSPELPGFLKDLQTKTEELNTRITPLKTFVESHIADGEDEESDELLAYLDAKQQLLMSYCVNITFYLYLKAQGEATKNHPVMKQLLELRYVMEKMRPLEGESTIVYHIACIFDMHLRNSSRSEAVMRRCKMQNFSSLF
jgi:U3 small nucleolar RNA-associated protein 3